MRAAVTDQSAALRQAEVKGQQRAVLQTDRPQGRAVDLQHTPQEITKIFCFGILNTRAVAIHRF